MIVPKEALHTRFVFQKLGICFVGLKHDDDDLFKISLCVSFMPFLSGKIY
jgi:hypothetical protein